MRIRSLMATLVASTALTGILAAPAPAATPGDRSLAAVLTADGNRFDRSSADYDLLTEAVLAVLADNPESPVRLLTDGEVALTAFIPNDWSLRMLTRDLTGTWHRTEERTFAALAEAVGLEAIETVLLYHVVPGATLTAADALAADGASLETAQGGSFEVDVYYKGLPLVRLRDADRNDIDPYLDPRALNINEGNRQVAHGVLFVLRPVDL